MRVIMTPLVCPFISRPLKINPLKKLKTENNEKNKSYCYNADFVKYIKFNQNWVASYVSASCDLNKGSTDVGCFPDFNNKKTTGDGGRKILRRKKKLVRIQI